MVFYCFLSSEVVDCCVVDVEEIGVVKVKASFSKIVTYRLIMGRASPLGCASSRRSGHAWPTPKSFVVHKSPSLLGPRGVEYVLLSREQSR